MKLLLNLTAIKNASKSIRNSLFQSKKATADSRKIFLRKTKVKSDAIKRRDAFFRQKKQNDKRVLQEAAIEAKNIVTNPIKVVGKAAGGFLSRILSFIGTLLLGWIINNLPTIIAMAQEFIARARRLYELLTGFISKVFSSVESFGNVLGAIFQNIITLDFFDTSNRVKNSLDDLQKNFDDMGKQLDEGIRLVTTSLTEPIAPGGPGYIPPTGTDYGPEPTTTGEPAQPYTGPETTHGGTRVSPQAVYSYLRSKGISHNHSMGILANIKGESDFQIGVTEKGDSQSGVGLFQYSNVRKPAFLRAVPDYKTNWKAQIDYAIKEDRAPEYLKTQFSSAEEAAYWWMSKWERPAARVYSSRNKKHNDFIRSFKAGEVKPAPTSTTATSTSQTSLLSAAKSLKGMDTSSGPGGGSVSCVYAVNKVFAKAGISTPWGGAQSTDQVIYGLKRNNWIQVSTKDAKPGDVWVYDANDGRRGHVGIMMDNGKVLSNSTSRAKFIWEATPQELLSTYPASGMTPPGGAFYRMPGSTQQKQTRSSSTTTSSTTTSPTSRSTSTSTSTTTTATSTPTESIIKGRRSAYIGSSNVVSTGYKDASGRDIKLNPGAAQSFKQMIADGMPFSSGDVENVYRDENEYLRLKSQGDKPASNSKHNFGKAADIHGAMNTWIRKNGAKYGWYANDYSGTHGGHFEWRGGGSSVSPQTPAQPDIGSSIQETQTPAESLPVISTTGRALNTVNTIQTPIDDSPQFIYIDDMQQQRPPQPSGKSSGGMLPIIIDNRNKLMKDMLLLNLSYT